MEIQLPGSKLDWWLAIGLLVINGHGLELEIRHDTSGHALELEIRHVMNGHVLEIGHAMKEYKSKLHIS